VNILDNIIGFISPQTAYKRQAYRNAIKERNYDAGNQGRLNANWRTTNDSAEFTDRYSRDDIRARARDLERNSDIFNSVVLAYKRNIIGMGYNLQAKTDDVELNELIESNWKEWCKKRNCDVTETQNLNQILRMIIQRKKVDGGILIHKVYTKGGLLPFKLQLIEVDELDETQMCSNSSRNKVAGGIELNEYNKPVGYWIKQYSVDGFSMDKPVYVEAKDIIYCFTKRRPSQIREMSDMTPTITRIRDVNEYMTAVSVKERVLACLSVFIKSITPQTGTSIGRTKVLDGENYNYNGKMLTPGMIRHLNPGDEVFTVNPSGNSENAAEYIKQQQHLIGAGQGLSYEATSRDMSKTTYSSARQAGIEDDMTYQEEKEIIIEILDEIYETFIISLYLSGQLKVKKDFWENKKLFFKHDWVQSPKRWIDPKKEADATRIAILSGQKTFQQIASENGKDWKAQIDDMSDAIEYAKSKGVDLSGILYETTAEGGDDDEGTSKGQE
jgi:phage portal protein, lambda family